VLNVFRLVEHRLAHGERRRERTVCFTQRAREGKFHSVSPPLDSSALAGETQHSGRRGELGGGGCSWRREVNWEATWTRELEAHFEDAGAMHTSEVCIRSIQLRDAHPEDKEVKRT
jgi:hypothetical protein